MPIYTQYSALEMCAALVLATISGEAEVRVSARHMAECTRKAVMFSFSAAGHTHTNTRTRNLFTRLLCTTYGSQCHPPSYTWSQPSHRQWSALAVRRRTSLHRISPRIPIRWVKQQDQPSTELLTATALRSVSSAQTTPTAPCVTRRHSLTYHYLHLYFLCCLLYL